MVRVFDFDFQLPRRRLGRKTAETGKKAGEKRIFRISQKNGVCTTQKRETATRAERGRWYVNAGTSTAEARDVLRPGPPLPVLLSSGGHERCSQPKPPPSTSATP